MLGFGKPDKIIKQAKMLVQAARIHATASYMPTTDLFPAIWDRLNGVQALDDCRSLFASQSKAYLAADVDPSLVAPDALGFWIVANLLGRLPKEQEEYQLARALGGMQIHALFDWCQ